MRSWICRQFVLGLPALIVLAVIVYAVVMLR